MFYTCQNSATFSESETGEQTLDTAYATVDVKERGALAMRAETEDGINNRSGDVTKTIGQ